MQLILQQIRAHRYLLLLLVVFAVFTRIFPLRVQAIEPYLYAASAEGYYDLSTTFAAAQPGVRLPNFSGYHPNHPLLHAVVALVHRITGIGALQLFKAMNLMAALCCLSLVYVISLKLRWPRPVALFNAGVLAATYAFWVGALSGEVHLVAVALQLASMLFLVKFLQGEEKAGTSLRIATLLFALSVSVHLAAVFWGISFAAAVLVHPGPNRPRLYVQCISIFAFVLLAVYGVLLVAILKIDSFAVYKSTMMIYTYLQHVRYTGLEWIITLLKSMGQSLAFGLSWWAVLLKMTLGILFVAGVWQLSRGRAVRGIKVLLLCWPIAYIFSHAVFGARADSIHSWLFTITGLVFAFGFLAERIIGRPELRIYLVLFIGIVAGNNLLFGILPNSRLTNSEFLYAEDPQVLLSGNGIDLAGAHRVPLVVLAKDPVLTFPEIWNLGSQLGYKNQVHFIYCCGKNGYREPLAEYARVTAEFFLLVDEISDEMPQMLEALGRKYRLLAEKRGEVNPATLVSSIYFERTKGYRIRKEVRIYYVHGVVAEPTATTPAR